MRTRWPAALCACAAVAMMAYGVWRGEMIDVWKKAVVLCLECIGIG